MRTLAIQVKLRRLVRVLTETVDRLGSEPHEPALAGSAVDRLLELSSDLRQAWLRESRAAPPGDVLASYVADSLRSMDFAIAGLQQAGADLELLRRDFETAALPLEVFLRGLDLEPALQRSA